MGICSYFLVSIVFTLDANFPSRQIYKAIIVYKTATLYLMVKICYINKNVEGGFKLRVLLDKSPKQIVKCDHSNILRLE